MPIISHIGADLFYADRGAGEPVVFLHGGDATHSSWRYQLNAFAKRYRVIAPDARGYGRSVVPFAIHRRAQEVDDLREILDQLGIERAIFIGYSMGSLTLREFVERYPERAKAVILVGTSYYPDAPPPTVEAVRARVENVERALDLGRYGRTDQFEWVFAPGFIAAHPGEWETYRRCMAETSVEGFVAKMLSIIIDPAPGKLTAPERWTMPTFLIWGEHDPAATCAEAFQSALPHAEVRIVPGHGHAIYFSAPEIFNQEVLAFLDRHA